MLRHQVLTAWNNYKEKAISFKKATKLLSEITEKTVLPTFPSELNWCRDKLDSWTHYEFLNKIEKEKTSLWKIQEVSETEDLFNLTFFYQNALDMFKDLTKGWKKEKDCYAHYRNSDGPMIEDDW